jgi:3'-phosphoadenosine 5'-phosphosulfate sulfotransferase (PAPS reductase)/FAD synthetase
MGDRTQFALAVYACPEEQRLAVLEVIERFDLAIDYGTRPGSYDDLHLVDRAYTDETYGDAPSDVADALVEAAPGSTFHTWTEPAYEWLGVTVMCAPDLGRFQADCDASGAPIAWPELLREDVARQPIAATRDDILAVIDRHTGAVWRRRLRRLQLLAALDRVERPGLAADRAAAGVADIRGAGGEVWLPGPMGHGMMYRRLKERAVYRLTRDYKERRGDRLGLVAGIRRAESERRRARGEMDVKRAQVWISPLIQWTARERDDYIERHRLPRNPVVDALHMSGECLCGAYAKPGELRDIELWYPADAAEIRRLERLVTAAGRRFSRWGHGQAGSTALNAAGQGSLFEDHLCWACNVRVAGPEQRSSAS